MIPDPQLPLFECAPDDPNVLRLVGLLARAADWLTAREILEQLGLEPNEDNRRSVRAWAEAAADELISGQHGYRHIDRASAEEIHHFVSWMNRQGDKMKLRAARTRARAHATVG